MGVAATRRGDVAISRQIAADAPHPDAVLLRDLDATPRDADAVRPFGPIRFVAGHGGWWAECPITGFGYWYRSLRRAIARYRVALTTIRIEHGGPAYYGVPVVEVDDG